MYRDESERGLRGIIVEWWGWKSLMNDIWYFKTILCAQNLCVSGVLQAVVAVRMIHVGVCWNILLSRVECSSLQFADSQSLDNPISFFFFFFVCVCKYAHPSTSPLCILPPSLSFEDLCGAHRQESLILRLGRPYTLLLHILHAYIESVHAQGEICGFCHEHIWDSNPWKGGLSRCFIWKRRKSPPTRINTIPRVLWRNLLFEA